MKKQLNVINIDGTKGLGKTTQINLLGLYFKKHKIPFIINTLDDTIPTAIQVIEKTTEFLIKYSDGIVINDGSIAEMVVIDMSRGIHLTDLAEKYKDILQKYEVLNHRFNMANLLLVPDNLEMCHDRIIKRANLLGKESDGLEDWTLAKYIILGLRDFNYYSISGSMVFNVIDIYESETMLNVYDKIKKILKENFEIKKPLTKRG